MGLLDGKVEVITGAGSGMAKASAESGAIIPVDGGWAAKLA